VIPRALDPCRITLTARQVFPGTSTAPPPRGLPCAGAGIYASHRDPDGAVQKLHRYDGECSPVGGETQTTLLAKGAPQGIAYTHKKLNQTP